MRAGFLAMVCAAGMSSACTYSALVIRGEGAFAARLAESATRIHAEHLCPKQITDEKRDALVVRNDHRIRVKVMHHCAQ